MLKIVVAIPCMDSVPTGFLHCLLGLRSKYAQINLLIQSGSLVYDARNQLASRAVDAEADYIFWLDSDMVFEADILDRMIEAIGDKDFLSGLYFGRRPPFRPMIFETNEYIELEDDKIESKADVFEHIPEGQFEIEGCGFGCVLMKTQIIKDIYEKQGLPFSPLLGFGEDLSFCLKAKEAGYKLWCDSRITPNHIAHINIGGPDYIQTWNAQHSENSREAD